MIKPSGRMELSGLSNFYNDEIQIIGAKHYSRVTYENLYDGIHLQYLWTSEGLKYEFIVDPFADVDQIKMKYNYIDGLQIEDTKIIARMGEFQYEDRGLKVFYAEAKLPIPASFSGNSNKKIIEFDLDLYDTSQVIVIDPYMISFSTFLGGIAFDDPFAIDIDSEGNIIVSGVTLSNDFPIAGNPINDTLATRAATGFVFKFSSDGSELLFSTFIGGKNSAINTQTVDEMNNIYLAGWTEENFPTTDKAYNQTFGGIVDGFIMKLSSNGLLLQSTYIGGNSDDWIWDLTIGPNGNIYTTGYTTSTDFPTTDNSSYSGKGTLKFGDAFTSILSSNMSTLLFSKYIGGTDDEYGRTVVLDNSNNLIITGGTLSADFPITSNAFDTTYNGIGKSDAPSSSQLLFGGDVFVTKVSINDSKIVYSTFIGGTKAEWPFGMQIDNDENLYIAGTTVSSDFPVKNGFDTTYNGNEGNYRYYGGDSFAFKLKSDGSDLLYSTYIGGSGYDLPFAIQKDDHDQLYISGTTTSTDYPLKDPNYSELNNGIDIMITVLSADGSNLEYSSYLGGIRDEWSNTIAIDQTSDDALKPIILAAITESLDFPTSCEAFQQKKKGGADSIVIRLDPSSTANNSLICGDEPPPPPIPLRIPVIIGSTFLLVLIVILVRKNKFS